nr:hypothetical protein Iba_chr05bCG5200 [Ipomoea batatas]
MDAVVRHHRRPKGEAEVAALPEISVILKERRRRNCYTGEVRLSQVVFIEKRRSSPVVTGTVVRRKRSSSPAECDKLAQRAEALKEEIHLLYQK